MKKHIPLVVRRYWPRLLFVAMFVLIVTLLYVFEVYRWFTLERMREYQVQIDSFIKRYYWQSVIMYIMAYILESIFALPLAAPLSLAGGFFYGFGAGLLYVMIGSTSGATASFVLTRFALGHIIQRMYQDRLQRFNREIDRYGAYYLLFLRIVPVFPFFMINMFAGLTSLRLVTFIVITFFGMIPMAAVYVYAGTQLHVLHRPRAIWSWEFILAIVLLGLAVGGAIIGKRWWQSRRIKQK